MAHATQCTEVEFSEFITKEETSLQVPVFRKLESYQPQQERNNNKNNNNNNKNNNNNTNPVFDAKVSFAQRAHCILLVFELYVPAGQLQDHKQLSLILQCVWCNFL